MKKLLAFLIAVVPLCAQSPVNPSSGPPPIAIEKQLFYDGSNNLIYVCLSPQFGKLTTWSVAAGTVAQIVDSSNTSTITFSAAHGLYIGARITISGITTSGGTALNGRFTVVTVPSSTTVTITTSGVTDATYTDSTLQVITNNPLLTNTVWSIQVQKFASNILQSTDWADGAVNYSLACSNRTSY